MMRRRSSWVRNGSSSGKRRGRIQGQTSAAARAANLLQGFGNFVFRFRFNVDRDGVRSSVDKTGQVMIGMLDHEMDVERQSGELANSRDHSRSEGNVVDEVSVHDIAMNPIGPGLLNSLHFIGQSGKIGGENGGSDQDSMHGVMSIGQNQYPATPALHYSIFPCLGSARMLLHLSLDARRLCSNILRVFRALKRLGSSEHQEFVFPVRLWLARNLQRSHS